jgi:acyl-coenzyme A thioesterase PaaI-like protein
MSTQPTHSPAATVDYTLKLPTEARGRTLIARARVLRAGTLTVASVDLHTLTATSETLCATALVTTRLFPSTTADETTTR